VTGEAVRRIIEHVDLASPKVASSVSYAGAGIAAVSAWGLQEWGAVIGIVLGLGTYLWNRKAKRASIEASEAARKADEAKRQWYEEHEP
jgi:hypothetical protein